MLSVSSPEAERRARTVGEFLVGKGARGVYLTVRERGPTSERTGTERHAPLAGEAAPPRLVVDEHGMRLVVELGRGVQTGLFVDQRDNRKRVRELSRGARVLNLFSYTSSFGVAAALGGAAKVVNVDVSRRALEVARENFRENGLDPAQHGFEQADALEWLSRAAQRGERFELVVLDPPSFASAAGGAAFNVREHYGLAAERAFRVLAPGGPPTRRHEPPKDVARPLARRAARRGPARARPRPSAEGFAVGARLSGGSGQARYRARACSSLSSADASLPDGPQRPISLCYAGSTVSRKNPYARARRENARREGARVSSAQRLQAPGDRPARAAPCARTARARSRRSARLVVALCERTRRTERVRARRRSVADCAGVRAERHRRRRRRARSRERSARLVRAVRRRLERHGAEHFGHEGERSGAKLRAFHAGARGRTGARARRARTSSANSS